MILLLSHIETVIDKQQIEREYLRVPKFALRALGFWPHDKFVSCKVLPLVCASLIILVLGVIAELGFAYTHINNLPLALDGLCPALTKGVTVIKFLVFLQTRDEVAKLLDDIKLKWINDSLKPLGMMLQQYLRGKEIVRELPFKSEYPYDEFEDPMYEVSYIFISLTGTICVFGLSGMDGIFIALCLHISAQFLIIQQEFSEVTPIIKNAHHDKMIKYSASENEQLNKTLKELIRRHQEAIEMCEHMVELFKPNIFAHFLSAALVICCVSVNLLLAKDATAILYISYGIAAVTQLYVFCAGGTYLQEASYEINYAAYFTDWYKLDIRNQRLIQLVILRAQTPCGVIVPFFQSSLATFTTILRCAGSYIALFKNFL